MDQFQADKTTSTKITTQIYTGPNSALEALFSQIAAFWTQAPIGVKT
jgi:hypothetical protein